MKKILLVGCISFLSGFTKADNVNNDDIIDDKHKQNSTFFKMSRNSNRAGIFDQLQLLIKVKTAKNSYGANKQYQPMYSTYADIIEILGEPNLKIKNSCVYTLNPSNGCKAILEFDANKTVIYLAVKDCN